jgi:hypothetical protein
LSQQIEYFAKRCRKKEPSKRITLQELTADHPSVELFVHSVRSSKIWKWLILEGNFDFEKRKANKFEVIINRLSHVPQRFMERSNVTRFYANWFNLYAVMKKPLSNDASGKVEVVHSEVTEMLPAVLDVLGPSVVTEPTIIEKAISIQLAGPLSADESKGPSETALPDLLDNAEYDAHSTSIRFGGKWSN